MKIVVSQEWYDKFKEYGYDMEQFIINKPIENIKDWELNEKRC